MPRVKPAKPWPTFPLYAHRNGQWAKRIRGRVHYFGAWEAPDDAYRRFLNERADLEAGRRPRKPVTDGATIDMVVNLCLGAKRNQVDTGELSQEVWNDYARTARRLISVFGRDRVVTDLTPDDFARLRKELATHCKSLRTLSGAVVKARMFFNFAFQHGLIDRPIQYGAGFTMPTRTALRRERQQKPARLFSAPQIRQLLGLARPQMRAMILLGINCGFGNRDCALLTRSMLDLPGGWVHSPRSKTAIMRHCPLWPETVEALQHVLGARKEPKDRQYADRVFITKFANSWDRRTPARDPIGQAFAALLTDASLRLPGLNFYALRHTFASVGKQTRDNDAVRAIMGHVIPMNDMLCGTYDELPVEEHRLKMVSKHVRAWLYVPDV